MNKTYFNFKKEGAQISYQPFMYDASDNRTGLIIGVAMIIIGIVMPILQINIIKDLDGYLLVFGVILVINGLYSTFIKIKKTLIFDKSTDAVYQVTPLGKKKLIDISNVYSIQTHFENMSMTYMLTNKKKASADGIVISSFIVKEREEDEAFIFFENELIPMLHEFMDLKDISLHKVNSSGGNHYHI